MERLGMKDENGARRLFNRWLEKHPGYLLISLFFFPFFFSFSFSFFLFFFLSFKNTIK